MKKATFIIAVILFAFNLSSFASAIDDYLELNTVSSGGEYDYNHVRVKNGRLEILAGTYAPQIKFGSTSTIVEEGGFLKIKRGSSTEFMVSGGFIYNYNQIYADNGINLKNTGKIYTSGDKIIICGTNGGDQHAITINRTNGKVSIGTHEVFTHSDFKLGVNGNVVANNYLATPTITWADFVFEDGYDLKSLNELEAFIKEHGHLPEIPSAEEVAANGVNLTEMNVKLLQKVEELTLHLIEQDKEIKKLQRNQ